MEELRRYLRKGETLLWQSQPRSFPLLEGQFKQRIMIEWGIAITLAAWFFYVERSNPNFSLGVKFLVLLVVSAVILAPVVEWYTLKKQKYFLTDQRAILIGMDRTMYYIDLDRIDKWGTIDDVAQGECIVMGGSILDGVPKQLRWQSCHPKVGWQEEEEGGEVQGLVFYLPHDVNRALELLNAKKAAA